MNPRTTKEIRTIAPFFAVAALAPVLTMPLVAFWSRDAALELGLWLSVIAGVAMSAMPFGDEFINRTMGLLLTQPLSRSKIWRGKMLVLGLAAAICFLIVSLRVFIFLGCYVDWPMLYVLALLLFCVAGVFCTTPFWTLCVKNPLGTVAATLMTPVLLVSATNLLMVRYFRQWSWEADVHTALVTRPESFVMLFILIIYFACCFWFARRMFLRLEVMDSPGREIALPDSLRPLFAPLWRVLTPGHGSALRSLITKELYLQRVCFGVAAIYCAVFFFGAASWSLSKSEWALQLATVVMVTSSVVCSMLISLIAGGACVAEERNWGMLGWQLTLPPARKQQWLVKISVVMVISPVLGVFLPIGLFYLCKWLFHFPYDLFASPDSPLRYDYQPGCLVLFLLYLMLTSLAIYTSSLVTSTLRAVIASVGLILAGCATLPLDGFAGHKLAEGTTVNFPQFDSFYPGRHAGFSLYLVAPEHVLAFLLITLLAVLLYLGFVNFRDANISSRRKWLQPAALWLGTWIVTFILSTLLRSRGLAL